MAGVGLYDMRVTVDFCDRRVLGGNLRKGVKGGLKEEKGRVFIGFLVWELQIDTVEMGFHVTVRSVWLCISTCVLSNFNIFFILLKLSTVYTF